MKVRVCATVDIDTEAWCLAYGTEPTAAAIREDVQLYAHSLIMEGIPNQVAKD